ncbi:SCP2 sterol-binding domain-containing protein [Thermomonospora umbrina]|uniref:SCP-2 sterol transfer family protein n=1 Tax=Thermomonospora umbrina TaxID=111806 RepID=A0A3D9SPF8_9ACTN|nr:SCP2 sterol-binding domain-containing protein [Thermomonospora umbrina]REE97819.1 SCP-2 sterol transfer family protein [Thermomonospora umbrina]
MADLTDLREAEDLQALLDRLGGSDLRAPGRRMEPADLAAVAAVAAVAERIGTPGELRRLLEVADGEDGLIDDLLAGAGVDVMLDRVFALMGTRFVGERLGAESGVVQWDVTTPAGVRSYHLTIADGVARGAAGPAVGAARVTLTVAAYDLLRLCAGTLGGATGFMTGKIKIKGDMMFGAKLPAVFDTSAD